MSLYNDQSRTGNVVRPTGEQYLHHIHPQEANSRLPTCISSQAHASNTPPPGGLAPPIHHDCHTLNCPSRGGHWGLHNTSHNHIGVRPGPGPPHDEEENSDAEIQSFPVDYLPDRSALTCVNRASAAHRQLSTGRLAGPSHAHCANCGSGQALPAHHSHR